MQYHIQIKYTPLPVSRVFRARSGSPQIRGQDPDEIKFLAALGECWLNRFSMIRFVSYEH